MAANLQFSLLIYYDLKQRAFNLTFFLPFITFIRAEFPRRKIISTLPYYEIFRMQLSLSISANCSISSLWEMIRFKICKVVLLPQIKCTSLGGHPSSWLLSSKSLSLVRTTKSFCLENSKCQIVSIHT